MPCTPTLHFWLIQVKKEHSFIIELFHWLQPINGCEIRLNHAALAILQCTPIHAEFGIEVWHADQVLLLSRTLRNLDRMEMLEVTVNAEDWDGYPGIATSLMTLCVEGFFLVTGERGVSRGQVWGLSVDVVVRFDNIDAAVRGELHERIEEELNMMMKSWTGMSSALSLGHGWLNRVSLQTNTM